MVQPVVVPPDPESPDSPLSPDSPDSAGSPSSPTSASEFADRGEGLAEAEAAGIPVIDATQVPSEGADVPAPPQDAPPADAPPAGNQP